MCALSPPYLEGCGVYLHTAERVRAFPTVSFEAH